MNAKIKELIDITKVKFGLDNYYLQRHNLDRNVNVFNETVYRLCMEWFPSHITEPEDDDSNPEGTAVIEIGVHSRKFESVIFVEGKSYANGIKFDKYNTKDIIKWIERETGLTYKKQFQLRKEEERALHFEECFDGVAVSPAGVIEIKVDEQGNLTWFTVYGQFPDRKAVKEETYTLSLEMIEHLAKEQLKLIELPLFEQEKLIPIYGMEELYVTNDKQSTIPFEFIVDVRSHLKVDKRIDWDTTGNEPSFERQDIELIEDVSIEQALSCEPSPDSFPITKIEQDKCILAVKDLLRREYPNDTEKWIIKTLHRDNGYIHATLRANQQDNRVFQRKLTIMIDAHSLQVLNYIDNKPMLEMYDQFQAPEKIMITKEEAYEKIKEMFELKPYYVYDFNQKKYILCGKLDCQYGVHAGSGEVIVLDDL